MIEGKNILSFSLNYWDGMWMNRHQILSRLAKKNKVLFVSPPFYIRDVLTDLVKGKLHDSGTMKISDNLYAHVPSKLFPYNYRFKKIDNVCSSLRRKAIHSLLKKLNMTNLILFIWHPFFAEEVGKYNEKLVVYYIYDNFSGYDDINDSQKIIAMEDELLDKTDIVITTGNMLYNKFYEKHQNVICCPNGVDFELFQKAVHFPKAYLDIKRIPKPRIGYIGMISQKVDFDMLLHIASLHPEWSIVLVGPERITVERDIYLVGELKKLTNVFFLGYKNVEDLPYYVNEMDVCMMCYRIIKWTPYGYPLKLHEYLACGKPVIGSPIENLLEFKHLIHIAESHDEWERYIYSCLAENNKFFYEERVQLARENTWEMRIKTLSEAIKDNLNLKQ